MVVKDDAGKRLVFLTNNFALKPELITDLYRQRWQMELFFKWIKQHLRIKVFRPGDTELPGWIKPLGGSVGTIKRRVGARVWCDDR